VGMGCGSQNSNFCQPVSQPVFYFVEGSTRYQSGCGGSVGIFMVQFEDSSALKKSQIQISIRSFILFSENFL